MNSFFDTVSYTKQKAKNNNEKVIFTPKKKNFIFGEEGKKK